MKASELRIGNLVKDQSDKNRVWSVVGISNITIDVRDLGGTSEHPQLCEFIQAIPLTEEWLLKFGFKNVEGWGFEIPITEHGGDGACVIALYHGQYYIIPADGPTIGHWINAPIQYIHQLQNLYLALTGEELEIK